MQFSSEPSRRRSPRWATLLGILFIHVSMLWIFKLGGNQRQVKAVQYLSLFNLAPIKKQTDQAEKLVSPIPKLRNMVNTPKIRTPEAIADTPKFELDSNAPKIPGATTNSELNLDMLRGQAVQIERNRTKSDIEKMNDNKKLNLSIESTFDREINKIELPECRQLLLGKSMPERMRIIQDHSKKMFCRSSM